MKVLDHMRIARMHKPAHVTESAYAPVCEVNYNFISFADRYKLIANAGTRFNASSAIRAHILRVKKFISMVKRFDFRLFIASDSLSTISFEESESMQ